MQRLSDDDKRCLRNSFLRWREQIDSKAAYAYFRLFPFSPNDDSGEADAQIDDYRFLVATLCAKYDERIDEGIPFCEAVVKFLTDRSSEVSDSTKEGVFHLLNQTKFDNNTFYRRMGLFLDRMFMEKGIVVDVDDLNDVLRKWDWRYAGHPSRVVPRELAFFDERKE